ncbi:GGDEF domain-containing phosphodiesterase [Alteromonadaceae bacterium BrNp21-10]|nr:GGDEF domain-containing phosphodiesterase [Alteromonadaceae bacterium BrNp21-10]
MDKAKKSNWNFTVTAKSLETVISSLIAKSLIYSFERKLLTQLLEKGMSVTPPPPIQVLTGLHKDIVLLAPSQLGGDYKLSLVQNDNKLDVVTQLTSRGNLLAEVHKCIEQNEEKNIIAFFIIELNDFARINDVWEHKTGDLLLYLLARRLEKFAGYSFKLGRLLGDEFGLLVTKLNNIENIWPISAWIESQFDEPFDIKDNQIYLSPKIGISAIPHTATDQASLVKTAYIALNDAENSPVKNSAFYEPRFAENLKQNLIIESELNSALQHSQELEIFYQPKQALKNNEIKGVEALIRWRHPEKGLISPGEFIPVAEQSDLICDITDFVVDQVCKDLPRFRASGYQDKISINISARDFIRPQFVTQVSHILAKNNIEPKDIELEITEGAFISDFHHCCLVLNALRDLGFEISIDDFGTGYSSLSYLRKLPIDVLKVDMSFVKDIEKSDVVRKIFIALIMIADALNLKVVAEGVDNPEQKSVLTEIGCDLIQGYLLSKPLPLKEFCQTFFKN